MASSDIGEIPEGWFVMHCGVCGTSLLWVKDDFDNTKPLAWGQILDWAVENVDHDMGQHALQDKLDERDNGKATT